MKKSILTALFSLLIFGVMHAQNVPQGMNYQAVARNSTGNVLANQRISLRINLVTKSNSPAVHYSEVHTVTTNQLGLFTLIIGEGKIETGIFKKVPWSTEDIWMEVSIKDKEASSFVAISNSKLLAVPYAFHAMTASELVGKGNSKTEQTILTEIKSAPSPGTTTVNESLGNSWNAGGNLGTNATVNYLGTADNMAFVIRTNKIDRLRVGEEGNIDIRRSLAIGADLNVDSSVNLNRTTGGTVVGGTLAVDKSTQLNNSLTVVGVTNLNNNLNVNRLSPTRLTGTLQVDLQTNLNDSLRVNNMKSTTLTGILTGQKNATFNEQVLLTSTTLNADTLNATSTPAVTGPNGALVVMGGTWVDKNLVVRGDASFGGNTSFSGPVRVTDGTQSTSSTTGALTVSGGAGIGKNLNVDGAVKLGSTLNVVNNSTLGGTLAVTGATTLNNSLSANGQVTINKDITGTGLDDANYDSYPLRVQGSNQGIAVKIKGTNQASSNYVTFFDGSGTMRGRIEGNTIPEMKQTSEFKLTHDFLASSLAIQAVEAFVGIAEVIQGGIKVIATATSSTVCAGLGVCVTAPIPSLIVESGSHLALRIANGVLYAANVALTTAELAYYVSVKENQVGVSYESGSADYAEWLPKDNLSETFKPGDVVAIRNGKISKITDGATQLMVISYKPIMLGNMPKEGTEKDYEKVAFMGQVPVYVWGNVEKGDYIVATGLSDGFGIAVNPAKMKIEDYKKIVGVAWSSSTGKGISMVNVAIGLNRNDMADVLQKQQAEINELKVKGQETNNILAKLVPGFKEAAGMKGYAVVSTTPAATNARSTNLQSNVLTPAPGDVIYHVVTDEQIDEMFVMAEKVFLEAGGKYETHPFWKKFKSDNAYKASIKNQMKEKFKNATHHHEESNKKLHKH